MGRSPENTLLLPGVLSELAGLLLTATIAETCEGIQWTLLCIDGKRRGILLTEYLGLDHGTKILGMFRLTFGIRVPNVSTCVWSAIRLMAMIVIPLLNVVIIRTLYLI